MEKVSKEIKIGIAFVLSVFLLYFGISFLKGINVFRPTNSFLVVFDDVTGLTTSTPVTVSGLQVGKVYSIQLDEHNPSRVLTTINLNKDLKLPQGSELTLDVPMLGGPVIILNMNYNSKNSKEFYTGSDTIRGVRRKGAMDSAGDVIPKFENLIPKLDSILMGIQRLVQDSSLNRSMANINTVTSDLTESTAKLNILLTSINKDVPIITGNLSETTNNIAKVSGELKSMDLTSTYQSIDSTVKNIEHLSSKLTMKDNTVGLLLNDRQMYDSINTTINNASLLLKDVKENPQKYINVKVF